MPACNDDNYIYSFVKKINPLQTDRGFPSKDIDRQVRLPT